MVEFVALVSVVLAGLGVILFIRRVFLRKGEQMKSRARASSVSLASDLGSQIFLMIDSHQQGPYNEAQILDMLTSGRVSPETLSWQPSQKEWEPVGRIFGVGGGLKSRSTQATQPGQASPLAKGEPCILVLDRGEQKGPLTESDFRVLVQSGQLSSEAMCWKPGDADWQPVSGFSSS